MVRSLMRGLGRKRDAAHGPRRYECIPVPRGMTIQEAWQAYLKPGSLSKQQIRKPAEWRWVWGWSDGRCQGHRTVRAAGALRVEHLRHHGHV